MGKTKVKIGLALGGGASRGIAHIAMLEVFDELGVKPSLIVGCSIGALIGAGYAGGMSGAEIRDHTLHVLSNRINLARHIFGARRARLTDMFALGGLRSLHLKGRKLADVFLPSNLPLLLEECKIPFKIIATDYELLDEVVLSSGSLRDAVGASIAIPGLIAAPRINGRLHLDGNLKNPVPFNHARENNDFVVAIDVTGRPRATGTRNPSNLELAIGSVLIMTRELAEQRRKHLPPEIYISPAVEDFGAADFFRVREILQAAEATKDELKRALEFRINSLS
ncbi:MAG: patatin-like phospholipase family protein [Pseudomonadota bacterium]|nr:patatin-like phospholipase family protein [Pseudomonadota bacterium]